MSEVQDKLNQILQNPGSMEQIMKLANSLSASSAPTAQASEHPEPDLERLSELMSKTAEKNRYGPVLEAVKPYLDKSKQNKLDKAMRVSRLTKLARLAAESGMIEDMNV